MIWKWIFLSMASRALGWSLETAPSVGLMQQPTSQYYHLVYGAHLTMSGEKDLWLLRYIFSERPVFESQGFADQDRLQMFVAGGKVRELMKKISIEALIGCGEISGYLKPSDDSTRAQYSRRAYRIYGPAFDLQASLSFAKIWRLAFSHQTIVGITSKEELRAYVSWPYATYQFSLGVRM